LEQACLAVFGHHHFTENTGADRIKVFFLLSAIGAAIALTLLRLA
jgi:hypothetical protein